ncbi:MAG: carbon starvation CstA family protein, partial [Candidatus Omnitrophica bacterium]|nr:carbon starvation CstA family protein [Candidatus Omnitrophota bacterium]
MIVFLLIFTLAIFILAYFKYGNFLSRLFDLNDRNRPPSDTMRDGVDYLPAPATVLFGHHFSSIAGAGPVLGPIIAALAFGWLPVWLWVVVGAIFIGGVHDFSSLVISIRNRGRSIAEIANIYMSKRSYRLMLVFIWFTLVYIITVFADLAAAAFVSDGGVASSSCIFIVLAVA